MVPRRKRRNWIGVVRGVCSNVIGIGVGVCGVDCRGDNLVSAVGVLRNARDVRTGSASCCSLGIDVSCQEASVEESATVVSDILSPAEKCQSKNGLVEILSFFFSQAFCSAILLVTTRKTGEVSSDCHVIKCIVLCKCVSQGILFPDGWSDE